MGNPQRAEPRIIHPDDLRFESVNYLARPLQLEDANADWSDWTNDPFNAALLNAPPRRMELEQRRAYISKFDKVDAFVSGIFAKSSGEMIGFGTLHVDRTYDEFLGNILLGHPDHRNLGVARELQAMFFDSMFDKLGFRTARANVLAMNTFLIDMLLRRGWLLEHTSHIRHWSGKGTVEVRHFRLTREEWLAYKLRKAASQT